MAKKIVILLSDADPVLSRVYKNKFSKREGWDVFISASAKDAYKQIKKEKPQIIVTDVLLGEGNGFELLEMIRTNTDKKISDLPVVILTELEQASDKTKAKKLGATKYFIKNKMTLNEVIDAVKKLV